MTESLVQARFRLALDEHLTVLSVDDSARELLGFSAEDFLACKVSLRDLIHPGDADIAAGLFSPQISDRTGFFNIRLRHADGRIRCVRGEYTKEPASDGGAAVLGLLLEDAKSLWKSPDGKAMAPNFRALMENTDDFIFFKDRNHVFTAVSRNMSEPFGTSIKSIDLLGLTDYDVFPEKYADIYYRLEKQVFAGVPVASDVHASLKLDDSLALLDHHKYPIRNDQGEIVGLFAVVRDITEHMKDQEALAAAEEKYRSIFDGALEGIFRTSMERRMLIANPAAARILGYDSPEDVLNSIKDVSRDIWVNPDACAEHLEMLREDPGHGVMGYECYFKRQDGTPLWVSLNSRIVYGDDGEPVYYEGFFIDITKRKQAEAALRKSEESLKEAQKTAGFGNYVKDLNTGDWTSSETLDQLFGIGKDYEHTREGWAARVHPDDRAMMAAYMMDEILGQKKEFNKEYRIVREPDGAVRWLQDRGRLEYDGQGRPVKMHGIARDITETKLFEAALRESADTLNEAQRIAELGSYRVDIGAGMWTSSDVLDQLFGIDKDYVRSVEGWAAIVHPDERAAMAAYFADEVLGKGTPFNKEYRIVRHSDGAVRWVHGRGRLEFDSQGQPAKMYGTIKDITERKQIEIALRESEESLKEAQRMAGVGSFVTDLRTGVATRSDVLLELLGVARKDTPITAGFTSVIHPEDRAAVIGNMTSLASGKSGSFSKEFRIVRQSDGAVRWMHSQVRLELDEFGKPKALRGTIQDITERKEADTALRESKELLQLFIERAPAALAMLDSEMRYLATSRRWLEMHALLGRDLIGKSHYEIFPNLSEEWKADHRRGLGGEALAPQEQCFEWLDSSSVHWLRREIIPWRKGDGVVGGIILFAEDVTRQKEFEERLSLAASVFTNAREAITITDPNGNILEVNEMFTHITGYTREEVLGKNPRMFKSGMQTGDFYDSMWRSLTQEGQWTGEIWNRNKNGDSVAGAMTINAVRDANGALLQYVSMFSDITELKKHAQQLEHVTHYDVLTNLPNRALLADRLYQAMAQAKRRKQMIAVAYLDLDGFKQINDRHGRDAGDRLLTSLAFNMKCALREGDTLARLGGDEFVAVMIDLENSAACLPVLSRLLEASAEQVQVGDMSLCVSASIGITFYPQPEEADADLLLRQADQGMYQAKLLGGNRYHIFDPDHDQTVRGRHENLEHIRHALAAGEFVLYYQPKVNMRTGKVVGAEALIRWQHPKRGLLPPGMFLPAIEDHSLAIEMGEWVIDTALAQMESWRAAGLAMPVSVNVGAMQLQQPEFVDRLSQLLAAHPSIKPFSLEIEVLETSALQDVVQTSQVLSACQNIGVSFALDDFGTGYSSLTYLKRLPASMLKIDQSFVSDMLEDPENLNILEGILGLASAFHRQVIAEGVETVQHGVMLLRLGCELAQGYGIARPMPARDLPGWASSWRADPRWAEVPQVHSGNRVLLAACVEHRAWLAAFESFLQGKRHAPPGLDPRECRFSAWLDAEKQAGRGELPAYRTIEAGHRMLHELASDIVAAHAQGKSSEGIARLSELHGKCDSLMAKLETLQQSC